MSAPSAGSVRSSAGTEATTLKLHVDWTACDARGHCVELLPELLEPDPWGYPRARDGAAEPQVPGALAEHARRAAASCPRLALRLLEG
jgi:ferredoxin